MDLYLKLKPVALGYLIVALFIFMLGSFVIQKNKKLVSLKNKNEMEEHVSVSKELLWVFFLLLLTRSCRVVYPLVIELDCRISLLILLLAIVNFCFRVLLFCQPLFFVWMDGFLLKPKSLFWYFLNLILLIEGFFLKSSFVKGFFLSFFGFLFLKLQVVFFFKDFVDCSFEDFAWLLILISLLIRLYAKFRTKFILPSVKKDGVLEGSSLINNFLKLNGLSSFDFGSFKKASNPFVGSFFKGLFLSKRSLRVFSFLLKKSFYKGFFYCLILFGRVGLGAFSSGFLMGFCLIYYIIFWDFCLVTDYACMIQMAQASYEANLMFYNTVLLDNKASPDTLKSVEMGMGSCIFLFEALISELMRLHDDFFFRWYKQIAKRFGFYFVTNDFHDIQKQELNRVTAARLALVEDLKRVEYSKSKSFFKRLFAK